MRSNDPTFATTTVIKSDKDGKNFIEWLFAQDCNDQPDVNSVGSLTGTNLKFSPSILPVNAIGSENGEYIMSDDAKNITATARGECSYTFFGLMDDLSDGRDTTFFTFDIPVQFEKLGK